MSHGQFEVGQKAFIERAGKLLVVFRPNGWFDFPGGRIDEGEADLIESLQREVREETNLVIEVGDPFTTWLGRGSSVYLVGYRCRYVSGDVRLSAEHSAFDWIDYAGHFELDDGSAPFDALRKYFETFGPHDHARLEPRMIRSWKGHAPKIHPDAFVSEFAYVVGDVEIGAGSSVWPGTVIRGDAGKVVIGENTCIQDNSTVHADGRGAFIGDNVVMGHNVLCHADRVGDGAALGNGAVVSGSTEIGEGSIIGAGAVLIDGAKVPPNTLMLGVPAVAKGAVSDKQRERFLWTARHYAELAQEYKREGLGAENPSAD